MSRVQLGYTGFSPLLSHEHGTGSHSWVFLGLYYVHLMVCHPRGKTSPFSLEILARQKFIKSASIFRNTR